MYIYMCVCVCARVLYIYIYMYNIALINIYYFNDTRARINDRNSKFL
jgi:hypothetical protein